MRPCGHAGHEARARIARRLGGAAVRGVDAEENRRVERSGDGGVQGGEDGGEQVGVEHRVSGRIDGGAIARAPWAVTARAPQADAAPLSAADAHVSRAVRTRSQVMCDTRMA